MASGRGRHQHHAAPIVSDYRPYYPPPAQLSFAPRPAYDAPQRPRYAYPDGSLWSR